MAASLYVDPWQTTYGTYKKNMLENIMDKAWGLYFKGIDAKDPEMVEHAARYIDADIVLVFSDGTMRNDGAWIPF